MSFIPPHQYNNITGRAYITVLAGLAVSIAAGWMLVNGNSLIITAVFVCTGLAIVSFVKPEIGLVVLVFGMMLSPEIVLAKDPAHDIIIRLEDIFLIIVTIAWFVRTAINKQLKIAINFPLRAPILSYAAICIIATGLAVMRGDLPPLRSMFYVLKYIEYFVLFIIAVNVIRKPSHVSMYLWAGYLTCVMVTVYVYATYAADSRSLLFRATAPFEGLGQTEPASLGGYYLIIMSILLAFLLNTASPKITLFSFISFTLIIIPFVLTQSRASYVAFIPMIATLFIMSKKNTRTILLAGIMTTATIFLIVQTPLGSIIKNRVLFTFTGRSRFAGSLSLEPSAQIRIESWKIAVTEWFPKHPLLGRGVTGAGLVDAQFPRVLGETGLLGILSFLWLLGSLWHLTRFSLTRADTPFLRSLLTGFCAGYVGILVQSLTTNTFIIIRIMEPFWFLAAIVMLVPKIYGEQPHAA